MEYYEHEVDVLKICSVCDEEFYVIESCCACFFCGSDFVDPEELPEVCA